PCGAITRCGGSAETRVPGGVTGMCPAETEIIPGTQLLGDGGPRRQRAAAFVKARVGRGSIALLIFINEVERCARLAERILNATLPGSLVTKPHQIGSSIYTRVMFVATE